MAIEHIGLPFERLGALSLQGWADIGQLAAGIASLGAVVTVVFLYRQLKQQGVDGAVARVTGTTGVFISISRVFIEYPKMRKYFHEGAIPKAAKYEQALAIAVMMADAMDHVAVHIKDMDEEARAAWRDYLNFIYDNSPILREYLGRHRGWYPGLRKELRIECAGRSG